MDTREALELAVAALRGTGQPADQDAARRLGEVLVQRGMMDLSPGDPDSLPEFIDVAIDG